MRDLKRRNTGLSITHIATLAAMDGFAAPRRTSLTAAAVLAVLALSPATAALAQSSGDRQYADPLVTGDGQQPDRRSSSSGDGATSAPTPSAPAPGSAAGPTADVVAAPAEPTLPRTGAEPLALAIAGLALTALGGLVLATSRRVRHAGG
jgi:LPXTG-motif cell wall-anchored protein